MTAVLAVLGWLMVLMGAVCFLAPEVGLMSIARGAASNGREFRVGGMALLVVAGVLGYVLWVG